MKNALTLLQILLLTGVPYSAGTLDGELPITANVEDLPPGYDRDR
jgi:hypothetical protein